MDLSIIIVNWNSTNYVVQCVSSVLSYVRDLEYEIIVVDNASSDDSISVLPKQFDKVKLICSPENIGFARANNLGFQHSSGDIVLLLNPDTSVNSQAINYMHSFLKTSPETGAVGCRLLNSDLSVQTSSVQMFPTIWNQLSDIEWLRLRYPHLRFWGIHPLFVKDQSVPANVEVISGACTMVRRKVFEEIGLFSTDYFMYGEDVDLCYKIRKAGWRLAYVGAGTIVHHGKQSCSRRAEDGFSEIVMRESIFQLLRKTRGPIYAQLYRLSMSLMAAFRLAAIGLLLAVPRGADSKATWRGSFRKWWKILRWGIGLEPWTSKLGSPLKSQAISAKS